MQTGQVLQRVHAVDVAQAEQAERGEHEDADARAEVAAIGRQQTSGTRCPRCACLARRALHRRSRCCAGKRLKKSRKANSSVANSTSNGTILPNNSGGVRVSSTAPSNPPMKLGMARAEEIFQGLEVFAIRPGAADGAGPQRGGVRGVRHNLLDANTTSAGKAIRLPPPATELMAPPMKAAMKSRMRPGMFIWVKCAGRTGESGKVRK